jgi:hypothetical protein
VHVPRVLWLPWASIQGSPHQEAPTWKLHRP